MFDLFITRVYIALDCLRQCLSTLLRSKTAEIELPGYVLSDLARAFLSDIEAFFKIEQNRKEYEKQKEQKLLAAENNIEG